MKTAEEAFPGLVRKYGGFDLYGLDGVSYDAIVSLSGEILVDVTDNDYQGDSRYLIRSPAGDYGLVLVGWGSCSGCDALQGCASYVELQELMDQIASSITWYPSKADALKAIEQKDWEATHWVYNEEQMTLFLSKCREVLS